MPLIHSKSKKAMSKNIETEMHHGKPQNESLAIAYGVRRKAKKMAEGGPISAKAEKRPMPKNLHADSTMAKQNSDDKPAHNDNWTDKPTEKQAMAHDTRGKKLPIKRPRMVHSDVLNTSLYDEEGQLEESARPASPSEQPNSSMDEDDAMAHGHPVRDMEDEHSTHHKPYAEGGEVDAMDPEDEIEEEHHNSIAAAIMARRRQMHDDVDSGAYDMDEAVKMAEGGEILESEHMEEPNNEDQMSFEALKKENYNSSDLDVDSHMDSSEHGDSEEHDAENKRDMVSAIRRKMAKRHQF